MKTTNFEGGASLQVSETPNDEKKLEDEFTNPEAARFFRLLRPELMQYDPDIELELVCEHKTNIVTGEPEIMTVVYSRDMTVFPSRLMQWQLPKDQPLNTKFAVKAAKQIFEYWTRARARRNVQR